MVGPAFLPLSVSPVMIHNRLALGQRAMGLRLAPNGHHAVSMPNDQNMFPDTLYIPHLMLRKRLLIVFTINN